MPIHIAIHIYICICICIYIYIYISILLFQFCLGARQDFGMSAKVRECVRAARPSVQRAVAEMAAKKEGKCEGRAQCLAVAQARWCNRWAWLDRATQ